MSLKNRLEKTGTPLSITKNGSTPSINPLATKNSNLHASGNQPGWSLLGYNYSLVNPFYLLYVDGVDNALPRPTKLLRKDFINIPQYINNTPG
jgi:hypothetical protein